MNFGKDVMFLTITFHENVTKVAWQEMKEAENDFKEMRLAFILRMSFQPKISPFHYLNFGFNADRNN